MTKNNNESSVSDTASSCSDTSSLSHTESSCGHTESCSHTESSCSHTESSCSHTESSCSDTESSCSDTGSSCSDSASSTVSVNSVDILNKKELYGMPKKVISKLYHQQKELLLKLSKRKELDSKMKKMMFILERNLENIKKVAF